jgi:uncharacterized protein (TIGR02996 family)
MNEDAFLRAIAENQTDNAPRLVYADWLEEQGDERAEYIRLMCESRRIHSRLAEMQPRMDPAWVSQVFNPWCLVLRSFSPDRKIITIKLVREIANIGLADAKALVESKLPRLLRNDLSYDEALKLQNDCARDLIDVIIKPSI